MIREHAFAKLNLNLHLLPEKTSDGLYPVHFINCQLALCDEIEIKRTTANKVRLHCDDPRLPLDTDNLVMKAAQLLYQGQSGATITVKKRIPITAGLGGGSADAAATIRGLAKLRQIELTNKLLDHLASQLGKDVYYCLRGGLCEVTGSAEVVTPLPYVLPRLWVVAITPEDQKPSTGWMYQNLNPAYLGHQVSSIETLKQAVKHNDIETIIGSVWNDFDLLVSETFDSVSAIKTDLKTHGAVNTVLAGSGLTTVGFFKTKEIAEKAFVALKSKYPSVILTHTL